MSKLTVISHNDAEGNPSGEVIKKSTNNPEWGTILVMEQSFKMENGIIQPQKRIAGYRAKLETLAMLNLKLGEDFNAKMVGEFGAAKQAIQVIETTTPQYEGHQPKINPNTKEVIKTAAGEPIFYNTIVIDADKKADVILGNAKAVPAAVTTVEKDLAKA